MKICKVKNCENEKIHAKGYCDKHYLQWLRLGKILKRTKFDSNEIVVKGKIAEIILYDKNHNEKARAIIDAEDIKKIKEYKWYAIIRNGKLTPVTKIKGKIEYMANIVMNFNSNHLAMIDHKDRIPLNNTKNNLRKCTAAQNAWNQGVNKTNKSGCKGVCWHKKAKKWMVRIKIEGKSIYLGLFYNLKDAANKYDEAASKYHGEFAYINGDKDE